MLIPGYKILEKAFENQNTIIFKAIDEKNNRSVVIKTSKNTFPSKKEIESYEREYEITSKHSINGILKSYSLEKYDNKYALIFEDVGSVSLKSYFEQKRIPLEELIIIFISIVKSLDSLHKVNIIHKDINPSNLLIIPRTLEIKIIDFGIALVKSNLFLGKEKDDSMEGSIAYLSPEQTGRLNLKIDYRTDYYSMGVTFFELLTYSLPFQEKDQMEMIHSHIASKPESPLHKAKIIYPEYEKILSSLSKLILKLLEKNPDDRYFTAIGILTDLEKILLNLVEGNFHETIEIGKDDYSEIFTIKSKLFGREKDFNFLLNSLQENKYYAYFIHGIQGSGKTFFISELHHELVRLNYVVLFGSFDETNPLPYNGIIQAFKSFVEHLLFKSEEEVYKLKQDLLEQIGKNLSIIIDIIPKVELITGKVPKAEILENFESSNRFQLVFKNFVDIVTKNTKNFIIFLDNIHFAEVSTFLLLEKLIQTKSPNITYIFSYRSVFEKDTNSPIKILKQAIEEFYSFELKNLRLKDIQELLIESMNSNSDLILELSEIVYNRTNGNPFALTEFLKYIFNEKLIYLVKNNKEKFWTCNLDLIKRLQIENSNLVQLIISNLESLSSENLELIKEASVFGLKFNPLLVIEIMNRVFEDSYELFLKAVNSGILIQDINEFKFAHEKIQQAAYSLLNDDEIIEINTKIADYYLSKSFDELLSENIYIIANYINLGEKLILNQNSMKSIILINYEAGKKAKNSAAFELALYYYLKAISLIQEFEFENKSLSLEIYFEAADSAYSCNQFNRMKELLDKILELDKEVLVKARVVEIRNKYHITNGDSLSAIQETITILEELGVPFPKTPDKLDVIFSIFKVRYLVRKRKLHKIINIEDCKDEKIISASKLIASIGSAAYFASSELLPLLILKNVYLSLKFGHSHTTPFSYSGFGIILCGVLGDYDKAYSFGKISLEMIERPEFSKVKTKVLHMTHSFIFHWKDHLRLSLPPLLNCYETGIQSGDFEFAFYAAIQYTYHSFFTSSSRLEKLHSDAKNFLIMMNTFKNLTSAYQFKSIYFVLEKLINPSSKEEYDIDIQYNEYKQVHSENIPLGKTIKFYSNYFIANHYFLAQEYKKAFQYILEAEKYKSTVISLAVFPNFFFYFSLLICLNFEDQNNIHKNIYKWKLKKIIHKFKLWAKISPSNYKHKLHLLEAEFLRIEGKNFQAIEEYDLSIKIARENEYINDSALASELAGKFLYESGKKQLSSIYFKNSIYNYGIWGAKSKVLLLEKTYPDVFQLKDYTYYSPKEKIDTNYDEFNLNSFIKATETISREIQLDKLLPSLLKIILQNIGAEKAAIILRSHDKYFIECETTKESSIVLRSIPIESGKLPKSILNYVIRAKEIIIVDDALTDDRFFKDPYILDNKCKSILCYPILINQEIFGILYFENNLSTYSFQKISYEFLKLISSQAIISIENARLYSELETKVLERTNELDYSLKQQYNLNQNLIKITKELNFSLDTLKKDLGLAKKIQESILPPIDELKKEFPFDIASHYAPMETVGGDFFDFAVIGENKFRVFLADATGHGIQGALVTMAIKGEYENLKMLLSEPKEILEFLNNEFHKKFKNVNVFFTAICVDIDLNSNSITYSSAGHPAQILIQEDSIIKLLNSGKMIGIKENINYKQFSLEFPKNSKLFLFTDGLFEQINFVREEYGEERLYNFLYKYSNLKAREIIDLFVLELHSFLGNSSIEDDITFLVIGNQENET